MHVTLHLTMKQVHTKIKTIQYKFSLGKL